MTLSLCRLLREILNPAQERLHLSRVRVQEADPHSVAGDGVNGSRPRLKHGVLPFNAKLQYRFRLLRIDRAEIASAGTDDGDPARDAQPAQRLGRLAGCRNGVSRSFPRFRKTLTGGQRALR